MHNPAVKQARKPYVSFITCGRNDGYGSGLVGMQHSLDILVRQLQDVGLEAEIVIIDWNPPDDAPGLQQALRFPDAGSCVSIRVIVVPQRFHRRYRRPEYRGLHAAAACNVGLRRARGQFALIRPGDVYYTQAVLARIARRDLDERTVYRVDRCDIDAAALASAPRDPAPFLEACSRHIVQRHGAAPPPPEFGIRALHTNACGDFMLTSAALLHELRGYEEGSDVVSPDCDGLFFHGAVGGGARQENWPDPCRVYKPAHAQITARTTEPVFRAHERFLDALAARLGAARLRLRLRILLDYPRRRMRGLPGTFPSYERNMLRPAQRWARSREPFWMNDENWGLAGESLEERTVSPGGWER
jgi:hypothetical protein